MKDSLREKLQALVARSAALNEQLSDAEVLRQPNLLRDLSIELADISDVVRSYETYCDLEQEIIEVRNLLDDDDKKIQAAAADEIQALESSLANCLEEIQRLLLPKDPNDKRNIFLEIRAGTGGDEAAIFAGDLYRMYKQFVQARRRARWFQGSHPTSSRQRRLF